MPKSNGSFDKILDFIDFLNDFTKNFDANLPTKSKISKQKKIEKLTDSYNKEQLVLILGAGVSINHGLPDWNTLLQKLL